MLLIPGYRTPMASGFWLASRWGVSWLEAGVVLLIGGVLVGVSLLLLTQRPQGTWVRLMGDLCQEIAAAHESVFYAYGSDPLQARQTCGRLACDQTPVFPNGLADALPRYATGGRYTPGPPATLHFASGLTVYLFPERGGISDPHKQLPVAMRTDGNVMPSTHDREWVLADVNGPHGPNNLDETGDRVLLRIEKQTGQVQTAYQACLWLGSQCTRRPLRSFYDIAQPHAR